MQEWVSVRISRGGSALEPEALAGIVQRHARVDPEIAASIAARLADGRDVTLDVPDEELAARLRAGLTAAGLEAR